MYVKVKDLPNCLLAALLAADYHKPDVKVETAEEVSLFYAGAAGRRGFTVLVDLATGRTQVYTGSFGGGNVFNPENPVDNDRGSYALPVGGAVIRGSTGGGTHPAQATVVLHPRNVVPWLAPPDDLTDRERDIMQAFGCLKPGEPRRARLRRLKATEGEIACLVSKGFLRNGGGGVQITTAGKNTRRGGALGDKW